MNVKRRIEVTPLERQVSDLITKIDLYIEENRRRHERQNVGIIADINRYMCIMRITIIIGFVVACLSILLE